MTEIAFEIGLTTPQQAQDRLEEAESLDGLHFHARYMHALNLVEEHMAREFRGTSFRVGFARPPLGGGDAWLDEAMVPHICDAAEAAGWFVQIHGSQLVFTTTTRPEDP